MARKSYRARRVLLCPIGHRLSDSHNSFHVSSFIGESFWFVPPVRSVRRTSATRPSSSPRPPRSVCASYVPPVSSTECWRRKPVLPFPVELGGKKVRCEPLCVQPWRSPLTTSGRTAPRWVFKTGVVGDENILKKFSLHLRGRHQAGLSSNITGLMPWIFSVSLFNARMRGCTP